MCQGFFANVKSGMFLPFGLGWGVGQLWVTCSAPHSHILHSQNQHVVMEGAQEKQEIFSS